MTFSASLLHPKGITYSIGGSSDGEAARRSSLDFNPGGSARIDSVKGFCAVAMQAVINERDKLEEPADDATPAEWDAYNDAMRSFATALTHMETAKMWAVKGVCSKTVAGA